MNIILVTFIVILRLSVVTADKYKILPPLFKMDDYTECLKNNHSYCKIDAKLKNKGYENNYLWNLINDSVNDKYSYDRSVIHRAICVPKQEALDLQSVKKFAELHINEEIKETNLFALIEEVICTAEEVQIFELYDDLLLFSLVTYLFLILYATVYDKQRRTCSGRNTENKILMSLSLISNWRKVCNIEGNEDYKKLKSIQGIRFYNMLLIISVHTLFSCTTLYNSNPNDMEKLLSTTAAQIYVVLAVFLVQTFFLTSSFIATFQIYKIYEDHGHFTIKQSLDIIIKRLFRIGVCSTIMLLFMKTSWYKLIEGPLTFDSLDMTQKACKQNWWQTLCFVNNYLQFGDICHPPSWYLSVDFQLYIMTVITIYFILKYKLDEFKTVGFLIFFSCMLYGSVIYVSDTDIIWRLNVNTLKKNMLFYWESSRILYSSTYSSWTTSLVGMLLGIIYTRYKNGRNVSNKVTSILWLLIFFGLPSAVIFIAGHEFRGIQAAIFGSLVKPLFSLGIGIGILGMSHNMGGLIKRICENKYVLVMSNFSFATYIFQYMIIFPYKGIGTYSLMEINLTKMVKYFLIVDAPVSIMVGIICKLIFEQPGINLQKLFLPQVPLRKHNREKGE
ncbi:O-acyltransferase like protein-like [Anoplophora glabripennis]|uniref:O-acyltransferase like protein-like n=1 Tax=Anoplophora glabripennis TaxID=217634 RepID=UPI000C76928D|nr:O-acyltransferase like protein-like [Anoplophora glabripennis]